MEVNEVENELKHWGILGMKWGVRRYQNPDGSLTPEGRERYSQILNKSIKNENTKYKIAVKAIRVMNSKLPEINAQFTDGYSKEYGDAISKAWKEIYGDFLKKEYGEIANLLYDDEIEWLSQFTYYNIYDDLNHSDFLQHWGILGMKWGIRNYQNPDGSLTPEGRIRYGVGPARNVTGNITGVNDANALSDEELRKMTRRYNDQAAYYKARNSYMYEEANFKRNITPRPKERKESRAARFFDNVFGRPLEGFLANNLQFGLGAIGYGLLQNEHPEAARLYFNSITGLNMNSKDPSKVEIDKLKDELTRIKTKNEIDDEKRKQNRDYSNLDDLRDRLTRLELENKITQEEDKQSRDYSSINALKDALTLIETENKIIQEEDKRDNYSKYGNNPLSNPNYKPTNKNIKFYREQVDFENLMNTKFNDPNISNEEMMEMIREWDYVYGRNSNSIHSTNQGNIINNQVNQVNNPNGNNRKKGYR